MVQEHYCSVCKCNFYTSFQGHLGSYTHNLKLKQNRAKAKAEKEKLERENDFACQLASALEGCTLNPGDEVSLRDGRAFKADIRGTLFEIPMGS